MHVLALGDSQLGNDVQRDQRSSRFDHEQIARVDVVINIPDIDLSVKIFFEEDWDAKAFDLHTIHQVKACSNFCGPRFGQYARVVDRRGHNPIEDGFPGFILRMEDKALMDLVRY